MTLILAVTLIAVAVDACSEVKIPQDIALEIYMKTSVSSVAKLYVDTGSGFREKETVRCKVAGRKGFQTLHFKLPEKTIYGLRFDPLDRAGAFSILKIGIIDSNNYLVQPIMLPAIEPQQQLAEFHYAKQAISGVTTADATDPILTVRLEYPITQGSIYPFRKRIGNLFVENIDHLERVCFTLFLISAVAMYFEGRKSDSRKNNESN